MTGRSSRLLYAVEAATLASVPLLAALLPSLSDWDLSLLVTLLGLAAVSDVSSVATGTFRVRISGSFLVLVLAMVFLGGPPAAVVGAATIALSWLRFREPRHYLLNNLATYTAYPLAGGIFFTQTRDALGVDSSQGGFYLLVFATFTLAFALNFVFTVGYASYRERGSLVDAARRTLPPVVPSELIAAALTVGLAYLYVRVGLAVLALFGLVLLAFQYLIGELLVSQRRARELASIQLGVLTAMIRTLDLRDRMTARHSAAVARYSREIAREAGMSEHDQELVHTAGLLHDIGKLVLPDHVLSGKGKLSNEDWEVVRRHPEHGAQVLAQLEGYAPVSEIVRAHHERIDGLGYPRGLQGAEIPALARVISVADVYDVMTGRDTYREPVEPEDALAELRRVAGTQLDARFVEAFARVLERVGVRYRHGEDADFDAELDFERRVFDYAAGATA